MSTNPSPAKRARYKYDLSDTFEVLVGEAQKPFTVYTKVLTDRSEFFRAARSAQWLSDPSKPADLKDEQSETFQLYLNCAYFGASVIKQYTGVEGDEVGVDARNTPEQARLAEEGFETLVKLYLLADKLQDVQTANLVSDEIIRFSDETMCIPHSKAVSLAYESTPDRHPLRRLFRDYWVHETNDQNPDDLQKEKFPLEFYRDVSVEFLRIKQTCYSAVVDDAFRVSIGQTKCRYHQHDDKHPRCVSKGEEGEI